MLTPDLTPEDTDDSYEVAVVVSDNSDSDDHNKETHKWSATFIELSL